MLHHGDERSGCEAVTERVRGAVPGEACELLVCAMDAKHRIGALWVVHSGWEYTTSIRLEVEDEQWKRSVSEGFPASFAREDLQRLTDLDAFLIAYVL